ncbi:hypothetical protein FRC17_007546 [Serendipita sp. 399]|nr:hypothetical protein FRC17_007546 [Serendipita sp. 399]
MPSVQQLPLELVLEIMLYVFIDTQGKPHKYFQHFSLVCKAWSPYAQRLLFRDVRLHDYSKAYNFLRATLPNSVQGSSAERLGNAVHRLEMTTVTKEMRSLVPYVLRHCPKLYEFRIYTFTDIEVTNILHPPKLTGEKEGSQEFESIPYASIPLPQIQAISIDADVRKSIFLNQIFRIWPTIRHLVLYGATTFREVASSLRETDKTHLVEVQIRKVKLASLGLTPPAGLLMKLLESSLEPIRILDFRGSAHLEKLDLKKAMTAFGESVRSLRLPKLDRVDLVSAVQQCTSLEELIIDECPLLGAFTRMKLENVKHFQVLSLAQSRQSMEPLIKWLETLPSLSVLSWWTRGDMNDTDMLNLTRFQTFCTEKSIQFRHITSAEDLKEELIDPVSFPREQLMTPVWR